MSRTRQHRAPAQRVALIGWVCCLVLATSSAQARDEGETSDVTGRLLYESAEGWFIDRGRSHGLTVGARGRLRRGDQELGGVTVFRLARSTAQITLDDPDRAPGPQVGDEVVFAVPLREEPADVPAKHDGETSSGEASEAKRPFTPLLAPNPVDERPGTVLHGNVRYGLSWIHDPERKRDSILQRLGISGSAERLFGEPWSFEWDVDFLYRDGDGYRRHPDQRHVQVRPDLFVLRRHFDSGSSIGFGRQAPLALPSIGPLDAVSGEKVLSESWRVGALIGLRPDPDDLGVSDDEPTLAAYSSYETETGWGDLTLTNGLLASWFRGKADRHALLNDVRLSASPGTSFSISTEVDAYASGEDFRSGLALTRLNGRGSVRISDVFSVRAGWHQFQLAETLSRRSIIGDRDRYDWGHQRVDFGVREDVGAGWSFEQVIAESRGSGTGSDVRWTVRGRKSRLPLGSSVDLSYSQLQGFGTEGFSVNGGLSTQPLPELWLRLGVFHEQLEIDNSIAPTFDATQVTFDADVFLSSALSTSLQLSRSYGESTDATQLFFSLIWRF